MPAAIKKIAGVLRGSLIYLIALFAIAIPASAQVVFDSASNAAAAVSGTGNPLTITWNHTVGSSKKPYLVVQVAMDRTGSGGVTVTGVTYGTEAGGPNQPLGNITAINNGTAVRAELWGLPNPTPGTHQITVTVANTGTVNASVVAGARSFFNVFQTAPTGTAVTATGTSLAPAVAVTNGAFDYVVDAVAFNNNVTLTAGGSQSNSFNVIDAAPAFSGSGSTRTGANNVTMSWTATGTNQAWAIAAVALKSATPQILFDSASSLRFGANAGATFTGSWNHTTTNAANRYLVVGLSIDRSGNTATGAVRYGTEAGGPNVAMTQLGVINNGTAVRVELYGLPAPATGTHQITATITRGGGNINVVAGSQSFSGVDQSAPLGTLVTNTGNTATPTVNVTNTAYDYVVDAVAFNGNNVLTANGTQDQRYEINTATLTNFAGAGSGSHGYTNTTMSWTSTGSSNWAIAAVPLHQASVIVTKTASADVIKLGDTVTYTLVATNYSAAAVNGVTITDAIPAGATFVSQTGCAGTGPVTCTVGTLGANATSSTYTITVVPNAAGSIANTATVTWTGAASPNSSETVNIVAQGKVCATPGKDGAGGTLAGIKNDYWPGSASVAAGATSITIGARTAGGAGNGIAAGDLLIVMQMQDAAFDTTNDETYGEGTGSTQATGTGSGAATTLNNAGRWEYVIATNAIGAGGGTLTIQGGGVGSGLLYSYTNEAFAATTTEGQRTFQVIRVPQYTTATLGSTLTALPWNGATGGVLAVDVSGTLALGGATVSVNGLGFRGGAGRQLTGDATAGLASTDFRTSATLTTNGSKGEGITGTPRYVYHNGATIGAPGTNSALDTGVEGFVGGSYGRGAPGNSGGGSTDGDPAANDDNSGGGGGGNGGFGGAGGYGWNCACPSGGQGGGGISPSLTRITMGGGGGSGTSNNGSAADATGTVLADGTAAANGYYSSGANGGGVIIIRALQATGTATLTANGFNAYNVGRDGGGGGGAGGSVLFTTQTGTLTGVTIQAKGGNGGNAWLLQAPGGSPGERHGPGGGGGGGYVLLSSAAASVDVSGGTNGVTTSALDTYGAQPGTLGVIQFIAGNNVLPGGDGASCAVADLAVTDSATGVPVNWGGNITFTQTVTNNGPSPADSVVYTTSIPAATTFQSISVPPGWTCITPAIGGTGNITCTRPTLSQSDGAQNFSLVVQAVTGTPNGYLVSNTNSVSSLTVDSNPANNNASATNPVADADMAVTLTNNATTTTTAGSNVTFTSVAKNVGTVAATGATWSMAIPPNMNFQSLTPPAGWTCITPAVNATSGTINCSATSAIAAGASNTFSPVFKVVAGTTAGTVITGTATTGATNDHDDWNNTATSSFTVRGSTGYDMVTTMSVSPDPVAPASNLTFTSVVTNNGPNNAPATGAGVQWVMNVPANTNFQSIGTVPTGWSCATPAVGATSGTITCTYQTAGVNQAFVPGTTSTFNPVFAVNASTASGTTITGSATVNINGTTAADNVPANNTASDSSLVTTLTNADVAIVKTVGPNSIGNGQLTNYSFAVTNNGPATATNVVFSDVVPAALTYQSHAYSGSVASCSYSAGTTTLTCSIPSLPVGNTVTLTMIVQANTTGTIPNTANITGLDQTDPVSANNSSTVNLNVFAITLVKMRKLDAAQTKDRVLVSWQTSFESDNLGFNLYRDISGVRTKINKKLIGGSALRAKKDDRKAGYSYRFRDKLPSASAFAQYYLEDVDLNGVKTMHGPVSPVVGPVDDSAADSPALAGLGANGSVLQSAPGIGVVQSLAFPAKPNANKQFDLANDLGLKIFVSQEGWYRVTYAQMTAAGFDAGTKQKKLSLYTSGVEIPIIADNDGIEFYGLPLDTLSTGARTYWLRADNANSARLSTTKNNGGDPVTGPISFTYDRVERSINFAALINNGDGTNFFGQAITTWPVTQDLIIGALDPAYGGNATMDVTIQGATDGIHHMVDVALNGHELGIAVLDNQEQKKFTYTFPQSYLTAGTNTLSLTAMNGDMDVSLLADTRVTYQHLLRADNGELEVVVPGRRSVTVSGFTTATVRAIDVTDPMNPTELQTTVSGGAATFTANDNGSRTVLVFDSSRVLTTPELVANKVSSWNDGKSGADLLVISNSLFTSAASALATARQRDGITTAIVDIDDVYDEYNFGVRGPQAIKSFVKAATAWKKAPKWVLLLGDASFDARNYLDLGAYDFVPTMMIPTAYLKTASDDALVDFDGDGIADIPIGRIPARTAADASLVINRIASRGTPSGSWASSALFIADAPVGFDFAAAARDAAGILPKTMSSSVVQTTASPMNTGSLIADYIGHGSTELWGSDPFFSSTDAAALTNGTKLPFVVAMTCLTGAFHDVYTTSIAEGLLFAPNGGAIAVWGSSTLTEPDQQALMNNELMRQLFKPSTTIGDAARRAKLATTDRDVRTSWVLFGDPSMKLK